MPGRRAPSQRAHTERMRPVDPRLLRYASAARVFFALGGLAGQSLSANLITMYLFFETVTLMSMPLVLHDRTKESIRAALKYLLEQQGYEVERQVELPIYWYVDKLRTEGIVLRMV